MVNPAIAGRLYPPTEAYLVGREKVREFAKAVFSTDPASLELEAAQALGFRDLVAPPTFSVILQEQTFAQLVSDPEASLDYSRVVHGEQSFKVNRAIVAGDLLTAQMKVDSVTQLGKHTMVKAVTEITAEDGELVVTAISTIVVRGEE